MVALPFFNQPRGSYIFITDFALHLDHPFVIDQHMISHRAGECILRIRVDVHFDYAIAQRLANFFL